MTEPNHVPPPIADHGDPWTTSVAAQWSWLHIELKAIRSDIRDQSHTLTDLRKDFDRHKLELNTCSIDKDTEIEAVKSAFPNKDLHGHREAHLKWIKKAEEEAEVRRDTVKHVTRTGAWAAIVFLALAVWEYLRGHIR